MNRTDCINHLRTGHAMTHRVSRIIAEMLEADGEFIAGYHAGETLAVMLHNQRLVAENNVLSKRVGALEWLREVEQAGGAWMAKRYRKIGRKRYDRLVTQHRATHAHAVKEAGYE